MPVTKKYYLPYFESSLLVLGTCCCFLVFCRCLLVVRSNPSGHLLRPWRLWSPPLRSMSGDRDWLLMAACHPQPSNPPFYMNPCSTTCVTSSNLVPCAIPATSCSTSNSPASRFNFTCNGSAGVTGNTGSDQAVAAIAFKFKLNGPASTKSPLHIISSTCHVTPCGTVHLQSSGPNTQQVQGHAARYFT